MTLKRIPHLGQEQVSRDARNTHSNPRKWKKKTPLVCTAVHSTFKHVVLLGMTSQKASGRRIDLVRQE